MRKIYLLIMIIVAPLWILGATREIHDQFAVRRDGEVVEGQIATAEWVRSRPEFVRCEVTYPGGGEEHRRRFKLNVKAAANHVDDEGKITGPKIEVLRSKSQPQAAELVEEPTDSPWISLTVTTVGFLVFMGAMTWLYLRPARVKQAATRFSI